MRHLDASTSTSSKSVWAAWYGLSVLILASISGSVLGKGMISLVMEQIKTSLRFTDAQLGILNGLALTLVTAVAGLPIGWLADKIDRRWLLAVCVVIWSACTSAFGLAQDFSSMFLFAMGIALGEAVLGPVTYSIIPDLFPRERWVVANSAMVSAILLGSFLGLAGAGQLLGFVTAHPAAMPVFMRGAEPWRTTLIASGWTGAPLAILILFMRLRRSETPREREAAVRVGPYFRENARALTGVFFGFGLSYAAFGAQGVWGAVILQRVFHAQPADIGRIMGLWGAVAALAGVGLAALLSRLAARRHGEHAPMLVAQAALLLGLIVGCFLPFTRTATEYYLVSLVKLGLTFMATSLSPTVLQQLAPPHLRGRVIALGGMVSVLFASFLPWLIGEMSDAVFSGPRGILWALSAVVLPGYLIGLLTLRWGAVELPQTFRRALGEPAAAAA